MRWLRRILPAKACAAVPDALQAIKALDYAVNVHDCSQKAARYSDVLTACGVEHDIVLCEWPTGERHAVVKTYAHGEDRPVYEDPTTARVSWDCPGRELGRLTEIERELQPQEWEYR